MIGNDQFVAKRNGIAQGSFEKDIFIMDQTDAYDAIHFERLVTAGALIPNRFLKAVFSEDLLRETTSSSFRYRV